MNGKALPICSLLQHTNEITVFGLGLLTVYGHEARKILAALRFCKQNLIDACLLFHSHFLETSGTLPFYSEETKDRLLYAQASNNFVRK
jgi:hypothetical protein